MTTLAIQTALVSFLEEHLSDLAMDHPDTDAGPPAVYGGALPSADQDSELFPFILVRWKSSEDSETGDSLDTFEIVVGAYGEECQDEAVAEEWAMVAVFRIRALLKLNPILADRFVLQFPLRSSNPVPEQNQKQYLLATLTTTWSAPAPEQTLEA